MSITDIESGLLRLRLLDEGQSRHLAPATVADVMQAQILHCPPETPVSEAAEMMSRSVCSSILVMDLGQVVGIWTERDALRIDLTNPDGFNQPVARVMSTPVKTVRPEDRLDEVAQRFGRDRVRHYLVADDHHRPLGVLTQTDVVMNQGLEYYLRLRSIDTVIGQPPLFTDPNGSIGEAVVEMRELGRSAVVCDFGGEYGILTERDVVRLVARRQTHARIADHVSRPLLCVNSDTSLYRTRVLLQERGVRHVGVLDPNGILIGLIGLSDILTGVEQLYIDELKSALEDREKALKISARNLRLAERVIANSLEGVMITDPSGRIESVNPAFTILTGYDADEVIGKSPTVLSSGRHDQNFYRKMWEALLHQGHWHGEVWNRRKNGEIYPELLTITTITDENGELTHYAALFRDITELKQNEEQIKHLAYYDPLTGLPNRRLFNDRLNMALAHAHRAKGKLAVVFIDLDRFKRINDSLGHAMGDQVLLHASRQIQLCLEEDDTLARLGGDEFVAVISNLEGSDQAMHLARHITEQLRRPFTIEGQEMAITASVGVSLYPDDGDDYGALMKNADTAMYRAKELGRNAYQLYNPEMNATTQRHLSLEVAMLTALDEWQFQLYVQPLVEADGTLYGGEVLLRWEHPTLGMLPPADFIPLAEETGLIIELSDRVMREVCALSRRLQEGGTPRLLSFNISPRQFHAEDFASKVQQAIEQGGCRPELLLVELTESLLIDDALTTLRQLNQLHALGVGLALDDFGTGYSSLSYLKRFRLQVLKIDRAFVRDIHISERDLALGRAIIDMAHSLGMKVVAEGVELAAQRDALYNAGCRRYQGFYYARPMPQEAFVTLVQSGARLPVVG